MRKNPNQGLPIQQPERLITFNLRSVRDDFFAHIFSNYFEYLAAALARMVNSLSNRYRLIPKISNVPIPSASGTNQSPYQFLRITHGLAHFILLFKKSQQMKIPRDVLNTQIGYMQEIAFLQMSYCFKSFR